MAAQAPRYALVALVAAGGCCGAVGRWLVAAVLPGLGGTLAANVAGALALAAVGAAGVGGDRARAALATGLLASFTTYSTFAVETVRAPGAWPVANLLATYALGFAAVLVGQALGAHLDSRGDPTEAAPGGRP